MTTSSRAPLAVLLVLGSCTSLQLGAVVAMPLLDRFGAGLTTAVRLLLAAALLMAVHRPRMRRWTVRQWRAVLLFGLAMAGMNGFFYASIARIPLGAAVTIEFAGPLVLAAVLGRRPRDLACVAAAAAAIVTLGLGTGRTTGRLDLPGFGFALTAAVFWAGYILAGKQLGARIAGHGPLAMGMLVSGVLVAPFGVGAAPKLVADPVAALPLVAVAILSSFVPYSLEFAAMRRLTSGAFGVLLSLEPVVASVAGLLLLGQRLDGLHITAMAVVTVASIVGTLGYASASPSRDHTTRPAPPGTSAISCGPGSMTSSCSSNQC